MFSPEECKEIHEYILNNPTEKITNIAKKYNCTIKTISRIINGETKAYRLDEYTYPLRTKEQNQKNQGRF